MTLLYALLYGLLLCFVRFSGIAGPYVSHFALLENSSYFPNDLYVRHSLMASTTYLYSFLSLFGKIASNTYFIFTVFVITQLAHVYFIYRIAELLYPDLKKENVGLVSILLFLYDYPIFSITSQLVYQHTFSQTVVAMPLIAAGIYYFLKDKLALSALFIFVLAVPLHFKSAWFICLVIAAYLLFSLKKVKLRNIVYSAIFIITGAAIMFYYRHSSVEPGGFSERIKLCQMILERESNRSIIDFSQWREIIKFLFVFGTGFLCTRYLKDLLVRRKIYYFYVISLIVLIATQLYASFIYKIIPVPELLTLTFSRSMVYPLILSVLILSGALLGIAAGRKGFLSNIAIGGLFALAFFPNFKSTVLIYLAFILIFYFLVYKNKRISGIIKLRPLAAWMFISIIAYLGVVGVFKTIQSYKARSPFFPLAVYGLNRDFYECQIWAKENTPIDSMFVSFSKEGNKLFYDGNFSAFSGRSVLLGDEASVYLNYSFVLEHRKRNDFINRLLLSIEGGNSGEVRALLKKASWDIDYLVVPNGYVLGYPQVYSNSTYTCYAVSGLKRRRN